jgi:hypothetical protein
MRQLLYISSARQFVDYEGLQSILAISRSNNQRDRLSGLLWSDGKRFLQVLEGQAPIVEATLQRIRKDDRHRALVILHDRQVEKATFSRWSMARIGEDDALLLAALAGADAVVRGTFEGLISARRAA